MIGIAQEKLPENFEMQVVTARTDVASYNISPKVLLVPVKWRLSFEQWCQDRNAGYYITKTFLGLDVQFTFADKISVGFTL